MTNILHRLEGHFNSLREATSSLKEALRNGSSSDEPLMKATCRNIVVGQACSSSSSILTAYHDRLEYKFHHNNHGQVHMCMWFRDIGDARLEGLVLSFHVARDLRHFGNDYNPNRKNDRLAVEFCCHESSREFSSVVGHILTSQ